MPDTCANPLLLQWIKEWLDQARERNSKGFTVFSLLSEPISSRLTLADIRKPMILWKRAHWNSTIRPRLNSYMDWVPNYATVWQTSWKPIALKMAYQCLNCPIKVYSMGSHWKVDAHRIQAPRDNRTMKTESLLGLQKSPRRHQSNIYLRSDPVHLLYYLLSWRWEKMHRLDYRRTSL